MVAPTPSVLALRAAGGGLPQIARVPRAQGEEHYAALAMCLLPRAPAARTTSVIVWRRRSSTQPVISVTKLLIIAENDLDGYPRLIPLPA